MWNSNFLSCKFIRMFLRFWWNLVPIENIYCNTKILFWYIPLSTDCSTSGPAVYRNFFRNILVEWLTKSVNGGKNGQNYEYFHKDSHFYFWPNVSVGEPVSISSWGWLFQNLCSFKSFCNANQNAVKQRIMQIWEKC